MARKRSEVYDKAYSMYLDGLSLSKIALELSVTRQCVFKAFKSRGLQLRGKTFNPYQYYDGKKFTIRQHGYYELSTGDRMLMHRYVWTNEKGEIPSGYDIHHIDSDKSNNSINNLMCLPKSEHTRLFSPHNNQYTKGRKKCK